MNDYELVNQAAPILSKLWPRCGRKDCIWICDGPAAREITKELEHVENGYWRWYGHGYVVVMILSRSTSARILRDNPTADVVPDLAAVRPGPEDRIVMIASGGRLSAGIISPPPRQAHDGQNRLGPMPSLN